MLKIIATLLLLVASQPSFAGKFDLKIKLDDCQPDGIVNSVKEKIDHKDFWINQNVTFESAIEHFYYSDQVRYCNEIPVIESRRICLIDIRSRYKAILNCHEKTKVMCRIYGGFC